MEIIKILAVAIIAFIAGITTMRIVYRIGLQQLCKKDQELKNVMRKYEKKGD